MMLAGQLAHPSNRGSFLPTLAGNIFGGTVLFSVLSYAQVREEISATSSR